MLPIKASGVSRLMEALTECPQDKVHSQQPGILGRQSRQRCPVHTHIWKAVPPMTVLERSPAFTQACSWVSLWYMRIGEGWREAESGLPEIPVGISVSMLTPLHMWTPRVDCCEGLLLPMWWFFTLTDLGKNIFHVNSVGINWVFKGKPVFMDWKKDCVPFRKNSNVITCTYDI